MCQSIRVCFFYFHTCTNVRVSEPRYKNQKSNVFLLLYRIPGELGPTVRMLNPPQTYAQAERQMNLAVPKFKNAAITPTMRPVHWTPPQKDIDDVQVYKRSAIYQISTQLFNVTTLSTVCFLILYLQARKFFCSPLMIC